MYSSVFTSISNDLASVLFPLNARLKLERLAPIDLAILVWLTPSFLITFINSFASMLCVLIRFATNIQLFCFMQQIVFNNLLQQIVNNFATIYLQVLKLAVSLKYETN